MWFISDERRLKTGSLRWTWEVGIGGAEGMDNIWEERKKASKQL